MLTMSGALHGGAFARYVAGYMAAGAEYSMWAGGLAKVLGLQDELKVDTKHFENLLKGFTHDGTAPLVRNAGSEKRQSGWDLAFAPPKDWSLAYLKASPPEQARMRKELFETVRSTVELAESTLAYSRREGAGGVAEPVQIIVALNLHVTNRAEEPHVHVHASIINCGRRADGSFGTILSRPVYENQKLLGALFTMELATRSELNLGLPIERRGESFAISGIPRSLCEAFSSRHREIVTELAKRGLSGPEAEALVWSHTRQTKRHTPIDELQRRWDKVCAEHNFGPEQVAEVLKNIPKTFPDTDGSKAGAEVDASTRNHPNAARKSKALTKEDVERCDSFWNSLPAKERFRLEELALTKATPFEKQILDRPGVSEKIVRAGVLRRFALENLNARPSQPKEWENPRGTDAQFIKKAEPEAAGRIEGFWATLNPFERLALEREAFAAASPGDFAKLEANNVEASRLRARLLQEVVGTYVESQPAESTERSLENFEWKYEGYTSGTKEARDTETFWKSQSPYARHIIEVDILTEATVSEKRILEKGGDEARLLRTQLLERYALQQLNENPDLAEDLLQSEKQRGEPAWKRYEERPGEELLRFPDPKQIARDLVYQPEPETTLLEKERLDSFDAALAETAKLYNLSWREAEVLKSLEHIQKIAEGFEQDNPLRQPEKWEVAQQKAEELHRRAEHEKNTHLFGPGSAGEHLQHLLTAYDRNADFDLRTREYFKYQQPREAGPHDVKPPYSEASVSKLMDDSWAKTLSSIKPGVIVRLPFVMAKVATEAIPNGFYIKDICDATRRIFPESLCGLKVHEKLLFPDAPKWSPFHQLILPHLAVPFRYPKPTGIDGKVLEVPGFRFQKFRSVPEIFGNPVPSLAVEHFNVKPVLNEQLKKQAHKLADVAASAIEARREEKRVSEDNKSHSAKEEIAERVKRAVQEENSAPPSKVEPPKQQVRV